jgi:hypothetical protein
MEGLAGGFYYDAEKSRTIAVSTGAVTEVLRKLYGGRKLADELEGK